MKKEDVKYGAYVQILKEELVPAMGCTEPIALAYAAAKAREILGSIPDKVVIEASGSIIKNVKSVIVPNTNHLKGIPAAATAGIIAGRAEKELEVIAQVTESEIEQMKQFLQTADIKVVHADNGITFDIIVSVYKGSSYAKVRIANYHTNIVLMEKDGEVLYEIAVEGEKEEGLTDRNLLNMKDIWDFAMTVDVKDIKETLDRQIAYNTAIAEEGLRGDYGANIGSVLLDTYGDDIRTRAKAKAAAGSDARMNGCELPVIINSGSGNQGMTEAVLLQHAQEFDLHVHGDIAHFVDEQRAVVRQFKKADLLSRGACEGAFFMPEELVFEEMLGNRGRVYGDERPFAAAVPVHVVGHDLLAHARFPEQEHGGVRGGDDFGAFKAHAE